MLFQGGLNQLSLASIASGMQGAIDFANTLLKVSFSLPFFCSPTLVSTRSNLESFWHQFYKDIVVRRVSENQSSVSIHVLQADQNSEARTRVNDLDSDFANIDSNPFLSKEVSRTSSYCPFIFITTLKPKIYSRLRLISTVEKGISHHRMWSDNRTVCHENMILSDCETIQFNNI